VTNNTQYEFSYDVDVDRHEIWESPEPSSLDETVPLDLFTHTSVLQGLTRYLIDQKGHSFTSAARILGRSPKTVWASYHQTPVLPPVDESSLRIPLKIFSSTLAPLEALVAHLREKGFRNVDIARALYLSPKTTHTVWKRAEGKQ